jgi:hypothetical protein
MGRIGCGLPRAVRVVVERTSFTLVFLRIRVALLGVSQPLLAQEVIGDGWVKIIGLGPVKLDDLPAELRDNIRIPGQVYEEPEESSSTHGETTGAVITMSTPGCCNRFLRRETRWMPAMAERVPESCPTNL